MSEVINPLIAEYAKRRGMKPEQAERIWQSLQDDDQFKNMKNWLGNIVDLTDTAEKLPDGVKNEFMPRIPFLAQGMTGGDSSDKWHKLAEDVTMFREMVKTLEEKPPTLPPDGGGKETEELKNLMGQVQELRQELFEEKENTLHTEIKSTIDNFGKQIEEIGKTAAKNSVKDADKVDAVDEFFGRLEKIEGQKERVKTILGVKDVQPPENKPDLEEAEEILKQRGYRIEKPLTLDDYKKVFDDEWKKREQEIRREVVEQEDRKEKKMAMGLDLATTIIDGMVSAIPGETSGGYEAVKEFREKIKDVGRRAE